MSESSNILRRSDVQRSAHAPASRAKTAVAFHAERGQTVRLARGTVYRFGEALLEVAAVSDDAESGRFATLLISQSGVDYNGRGSAGFEFELGDARWRVRGIDAAAGTVSFEHLGGLGEPAVESADEVASTPALSDDGVAPTGWTPDEDDGSAEDIDELLDLLHHGFPDSLVWVGGFDESGEHRRIVEVRDHGGWSTERGDEAAVDETVDGRMARGGGPQLVTDVLESPYADVASEGARSYVGVPLEADGAVVGAVSMTSRAPSAYTHHDHETLAMIARLLLRSFQRLHQARRAESVRAYLQAQAVVDADTGLPNRAGFVPQLAREWDRVRRAYPDGEGEGSWTLVFSVERRRDEFARALASACRSADMAARLGEDEFAALLVDCVSPEPFLRRLSDAYGAEHREVIVGAAGLHTAASALDALEDAESQLDAAGLDELDLGDE